MGFCQNALITNLNHRNDIKDKIMDILQSTEEMDDKQAWGQTLAGLKALFHPDNNRFDSISILADIIEEAGVEMDADASLEPIYTQSRFPLTIGSEESAKQARINEIKNLIKGIEPTKALVDNTTNILDAEYTAKTYNKLFLQQAYGTATVAQNIAERHGLLGLVSAFLVNRGYISSPQAILGQVSPNNLASQIRLYQEQLYKNIYGYILSRYNNLSAEKQKFYDLEELKKHESLFTVVNNAVTYNNSLEYIATTFKNWLSRNTEFTDTKLLELQRQYVPSNRSVYEKAINGEMLTASDALTAYESFVILSNFDSLIKSEFGDSIDINETLFNQITAEPNKYQLADKADSMNKTWRTTDEIFVDQEVSRLPQRLIETIPLYTKQQGRWVQSAEDTITFQDFCAVIANIKHLSYDINATNLKLSDIANTYKLSKTTLAYFNKLPEYYHRNNLTFRDLVDSLVHNCQQGLPAVLDVLTSASFNNNNLAANKGISEQTIRNLIYSIHKGLTSTTETQSLHSLSPKDIINAENYYSYITQVATSIFKNQFLQCYYDETTGQLYMRTLSDQGINQIKRRLRDSIYYYNNYQLEGALDALIHKYEIKFNSQQNVTSFDQNIDNLDGNSFHSIQVTIPIDNVYTLSFTLGLDGAEPIYTMYENGKPLHNYNFAGINEELLNDLIGSSEKGFLEDILQLGLINNPKLKTSLLEQYIGAFNKYNYQGLVKDLMSLASHILINRIVSTKLINKPLNGNITYNGIQAQAASIYKQGAPTINSNAGEIALINSTEFLTGNQNTNRIGINAERTLDIIANAKANSEGLTKASQTKDSESNGLSNYTPSRLLGSILSQMSLQCKQPDSATRFTSLVTNPDLLKGFYKLQEVTSQGTSKRTTDFNVAELAQVSFGQLFLDGLVEAHHNSVIGNQANGDVNCGFLGSVNSDKPTIDYLLVNLNSRINTEHFSEETKEILYEQFSDLSNIRYKDLNTRSLKAIIAQEMNDVYSGVLDAINEDYQRLFEFMLTKDVGVDFLNYALATDSTEVTVLKNLLISEGSPTVFNRSDELSKLDIPNLLQYNNSFTLFKEYCKDRGLNAEKTIIELCNEYNQKHRLNPIELVDQLHLNKGLVANNTLLKLINRFNSVEDSELFWTIKNAEVVKSLLDNNFEYILRGKESDKLLTALDGWVNNSKMIIGKYQYYLPDGSLSKVYNLDSKISIIRLQQDMRKTGFKDKNGKITVKGNNIEILSSARNIYNNGELTLNPYLEKYNLFDYLITQEHIMTSVGSHIAHPAKKFKYDSNLTEEENALAEEAIRFFAQHKRNVSLTAAMHEFQKNLIKGIPNTYNIATVRDIKDTLFNLVGNTSEVKPYDGATFVHPGLVYLENFSLGAEKAGITKKQFVHFYSNRTANGGIIKTAGFGLTNLLAMNRQVGNIMRKMMNRRWISHEGTEVNDAGDFVLSDNTTRAARFNIDLFGKSICTEDNNLYADINYYKDGSFYRRRFVEHDGVEFDSYEVVDGNFIFYDAEHNIIDPQDLSSMIDLGNGTYIFNDIKLQTVDGKSEGLEDVGVNQEFVHSTDAQGNPIALNNNWDAYQLLFKGQYSYDVIKGENEDNYLHYSETSIKNLAILMNNMGYKLIDNPEVQEDVWQASKHSDIHYLVTEGAIKQGAANINSVNTYSDNTPFNFQRILTNQIGIQLDKEHHADGEELTLMRQVINACAFRGYSLDVANEMYETLSTLIRIGLKDQLDAFRKYIQYDSDNGNFAKEIELIVKKAILNSGPKDGNLINNLTIEIQNMIAQHPNMSLKDLDIDIPFSDSGLFPKLNSIVASFVNRSGIKTKIDGLLAVLSPSYQMVQITNGHLISYYRPEAQLRLADVQTDLQPYLQVLINKGIETLPAKLIEEFIANPPAELLVFDNVEDNVNHLAKDFKLGHHYFITAQDGTITSQLISLPRQYRALKQQIERGEVIGVRENILTPRDLAHYNVVFRTVDGKFFNMYDLDSSSILFDLREVVEKLNKCKNDIELLKNYAYSDTDSSFYDIVNRLTQSELGKQFNVSLSTLASHKLSDADLLQLIDKVKGSVKLLRRLVQRDLNALTAQIDTSRYDDTYVQNLQRFSESFQKALAETEAVIKQNTPNTIEFQQKRDDNLRQVAEQFAAEYQQLTGEVLNTNDISGRIQQLIDQHISEVTDLVRVNNQMYQVDKSNIQIQAYEIVMPKVFKTNFGLSTFDDVTEIINNPDFFYNKLINNWKSKTQKFDYELKRLNGDHIYILNKRNLSKYEKDLTKKESINKSQDRNDSSFTRLTNTNEAIYDMYYEIDENGQFIDDEIWTDGDTEIIVTNNPNFYIDQLHYNSAKLNIDNLSWDEIESFISGAEEGQLSTWYKHLINTVGVVSEDNLRAIQLFMRSIDDVNLQDSLRIDNPTTNYLKELGREIHSSFLMSLNIVAARIPAQSQQSMMPMKIVAFVDRDVNAAYVSNAQIWLQGSDYDIDAVSLAHFSFDNNGKLVTWSKYAKYDNFDMLYASLSLPFPTAESVFNGNELNMEVLDVRDALKELEYYNVSDDQSYREDAEEDVKERATLAAKQLANILNNKYDAIKYENGKLVVNNSTADNIRELGNILRFYRDYGLVNPKYYINSDGNTIATDILSNFTNKEIDSALKQLGRILDGHNLTINKASKTQQKLMARNGIIYGMFETTNRPVNLIQSQTSVDDTTEPFKKKGEEAAAFKDLVTFTPGNAINKVQAININQVGKDGIAICAVGMKVYSAWIEYTNSLLNHGSALQQKNLIISPTGLWRFGYLRDQVTGVRNKTQGRLVANAFIRAMDRIKNKTVQDTAKCIDQDVDAVIQLSALLSLATDNAKELCLGNLNAGTKMIGMYIYGLSIGLDFNEVARLLMSPLGLTIRDLMEGNIFNNQKGFTTINRVLDYLMIGPSALLNKFSKDVVSDVVEALSSKYQYLLDDKITKYHEIIGRIAHHRIEQEANGHTKYLSTLADKLDALDALRVQGDSAYAHERNMLIDQLQNYFYQVDTIKYDSIVKPRIDGIVEVVKEPTDLFKIELLAYGADEMKTLGQILGVANGIKTKLGENISFIKNIQSVIQNRLQANYERRRRHWYITRDTEEAPKPPVMFGQFNLSRFMNDEAYKIEMIEKYERVKHSLNILDIIDKVQHYREYLRAVVMEYTGKKAVSAKFRAVEQLGNAAIELIGATNAKDTEYIYSRVQDLCSDYIRRQWLMSQKTVVKPGEKYSKLIPNPETEDGMFINDTNDDIIIPTHFVPIRPGEKYFDSSNKLVENTTDNILQIPLGTQQGDATFKYWMETYIFPNLVNGLNFEGKADEVIRHNLFIKGLQPVITDRTPMHINTTAYSLGINMSPRDNAERKILTNYRNAFNMLNSGSYMGKTIQEWLWLYNQITFLGKPGQNSLTSIFDDIIAKSPLIKQFYKFESEFDKNDDITYKINVTDQTLIEWCTPIGNKYTSFLKYIYAMDKDLMHSRLMQRSRIEQVDFETGAESSSIGYIKANNQLPEYKQYMLRGLYEQTQDLTMYEDYPGYTKIVRDINGSQQLQTEINIRNGKYSEVILNLEEADNTVLYDQLSSVMPQSIWALASSALNNRSSIGEVQTAIEEAVQQGLDNEILMQHDAEQIKADATQVINEYLAKTADELALDNTQLQKIQTILNKMLKGKSVHTRYKLNKSGVKESQFDDSILQTYLDGIIEEVKNGCIK